MKKILSIAIIAAIVSGALCVTSFAEDITVEFEGTNLSFDVEPEITDEHVMVPLRKIFEEIGATVKWNNDTKIVSARKNSKTVSLTLESNELTIDKGKTDDEGNPILETVELDVPATARKGRILVPLRAISESFGYNVQWSENENKVVITDDDKDDDSWKENTGNLDLSKMTSDNSGIEIKDNKITITKGGDYTVTGSSEDASITVNTKERVKLRLSGVNLTTKEGPCIFVEKADKAFITISDDTQNTLVAKNSEDGAIYSKENLEIKGDGTLNIESHAGHGMKASDNLTIEKGNLIINATTDGIHINDTFKMLGGKVDITSVCDGIDSESIVLISGGEINIETTATPIENTEASAEENAQAEGNTGMGRFPGMFETAEVEFEKSSKGIGAEWMLTIDGGKINVNSASHAIHSGDEILINGGVINIASKYEKGISAHGNLTINGSETVVDISKSTEGLESKNVLTINDGKFTIVSTDDAINATGGISGQMFGMGNPGGNRNNENRVPPDGAQGNANGVNPQGNVPMQRPARGNRQPAGEGMTPPEGGFAPGFNFETDENGRPVFKFETDENGRPVFKFETDENGNPVWGNGRFTPPEGFEPNGEIVPPTGKSPGENREPGMNGRFMGGMGGMGRNLKECLIINGGYFEIYGRDDCIDSNGNMTINGGTLKVSYPSGSFTGNFGVLDSDGRLTIGEDANLIFACGGGNAGSLKLNQNIIVVHCDASHSAGEKIVLTDSKGNVVAEYAPLDKFSTILLTSKDIKSGETYTVTIGEEKHEVTVSQKATTIGTSKSSGRGFGGGFFPNGGQNGMHQPPQSNTQRQPQNATEGAKETTPESTK